MHVGRTTTAIQPEDTHRIFEDFEDVVVERDPRHQASL